MSKKEIIILVFWFFIGMFTLTFFVYLFLGYISWLIEDPLQIIKIKG